MKRIILSCFLAGIVALLVVSCQSAPTPPPPTASPSTTPTSTPAQKITWRGDIAVADTHYFTTQLARPFADEVSKKSGGQLEIKMFPGGSLGFKGTEQLRVLQGNAIEMVVVTVAAWNEGDLPALGIMGMPLLYANPAQVHDAWIKGRTVWERELAKWGVIPLAYYPLDEQILFSRKPISSLDDLKGMKIRSYSGQISEFLQRIGAMPVTIAYGEQYSSLQKGVMDATITGGATGYSFRLWEVANSIVVGFGIDYVACFTGVTATAFNKLPKDLQKVVTDAAASMDANSVKAAEAAQTESWTQLEKQGMKVVRLSSADIAKAKQVGAGVVNDWAASKGGAAKEVADLILKK